MNDAAQDDEYASAPRASQLRRAAGLLVDWIASLLVATLLVDGRVALWPLLVLATINIVLVTLIGSTLGMRVARTRIVPVGPGAPWPVRVIIRTALLLLVLPAALGGVTDRALHDKIAGTTILAV